jgi:hypothetical protein
MKKQPLIIIFCFLWFAAFSLIQQCYARDVIKGQLTDAVRERIALSTGDKVTISVGKYQGLIKGDIGKIISKANDQIEIGRCVVEESQGSSSVCQIIESLREIGRGDTVLFDAVDYRDKAIFLAIIDLLDSSVKAYPTHEKVKILINEVFDANNNITQFSEKVRGELIYVASQKKRIVPMTVREMPDISYYPNEYGASAGYMKNLLKKNNLDMILTGSYIINGSTLELSFQRILKEGDDRVVVFPVSMGNDYAKHMDKIVQPYVKKERRPDSLCSVVFKPRQYMPLKEEKGDIVKDEAGGDPFRELNLKRVGFNIISPVEFKVSVDGAMLKIAENGVGQISLSNGPHRLRASFKRGYYSNESLLYTSTRESIRDALLELNKGQEVIVEVIADPLAEKGEALAFKVYRKAERERHALKPIQRFESEKLIETFVE